MLPRCSSVKYILIKIAIQYWQNLFLIASLQGEGTNKLLLLSFIRSILLETGAMTTTTTATTATTMTTTMMISVFRFPIEMCLFEWKTLDGKKCRFDLFKPILNIKQKNTKKRKIKPRKKVIFSKRFFM